MLSFCRQRQIQRHWQRHEPGHKGIRGEIAKSHVSWCCALSRQRQDMEVKEARPFHQSALPQVKLMFCGHAILYLRSLQFSCLVCLTFTTTTVQVIAMIQNIPIARAISSCLSWMVVFEQNKCRRVVFESLWNLIFSASFETFMKSYFCCIFWSFFAILLLLLLLLSFLLLLNIFDCLPRRILLLIALRRESVFMLCSA